jgi:hypothetical protein
MTLDDGKGEELAVGDRVRVNTSGLTVTARVSAGDRSNQVTFEAGQMLEGIVTALSVLTASVYVTSPRDLGEGIEPIDFPRARVSLKK